MRSPARHLLPLAAAALLAACGPDEPEPVAAETAEEEADSLYGAAAAENVRVTPVVVEVPGLPEGWEGMRVAVLSDFQLGLWPDNESVARAAVERAVAEDPDLVVLLGDYVDRGGDYAALGRVLEPLRGRPAFAVLGNEDAVEDPEGPDSTAIRTIEALSRAGVRVLRNERAPFARGGDTAFVAGLDPFVARRPDWRQAEIYNALPGGAGTPLLLSHLPAVAARVPDEKYPLILAGHTHCGRVEVPGTPRLSWLNTEVFPGTEPPDRRTYRIRGSALFVTCGVGYSFVPVRLGHPPEVALVTLRAPGAGSPAAAPAAADSAPGQADLDSLLRVYQRRDTTAADTAAADTAGEG